MSGTPEMLLFSSRGFEKRGNNHILNDRSGQVLPSSGNLNDEMMRKMTWAEDQGHEIYLTVSGPCQLKSRVTLI